MATNGPSARRLALWMLCANSSAGAGFAADQHRAIGAGKCRASWMQSRMAPLPPRISAKR